MDKEKMRVAIVGIGCRFPGGANSAQSFRQLLMEGKQALKPLRFRFGDSLYHKDPKGPAKAICQNAGFLNETIYAFDADFFEISSKAAKCLDPQQRLLLETSYEALEDAGIPLSTIGDTDTGVFIGAFMQDSLIAELQQANLRNIGPHTATGNTLGMTANRLSYFYRLHGPSIAIDTACSSSLSALHYAFEAVRDGVCPLALCGGVNLMTQPGYMTALSKGGFLSPTSACHAFSDLADGYARGEGAGVIILKPLAKALEEGDRIYCELLSTALNHDGRTLGISQPNAAAQVALLDAAYRSAGIDKQDVGYVEAHGTGTAAGDLAELRALGAFFSARDTPLIIGSLKTNIGHTEGAAGIASVIKAALIVQTGKIPRTLLTGAPNPDISFDELGLSIASQSLDLPEAVGGGRYVGVNSFGFGGSNAHVVVSGVPDRVVKTPPQKEIGPQLLTVSAQSLTSLRTLAHRYAAALQPSSAEGISLSEICAYALTKREHFTHRLAAVIETKEEGSAVLEEFSNHIAGPQVFYNRPRIAAPIKVLLLFSGIDASASTMGRLLYRHHAAFRDKFDACVRACITVGGPNLRDFLDESTDSALFDRAHCMQPFYLAFQLALAHLLRSYGVAPAGVTGHSVGELAAFCFADALSITDAFNACMRRSYAEETLSGAGAMLVLGVTETEARLICQSQPNISLAAINSASTVVLSGAPRALESVRKRYADQDIFAQYLATAIAYHSGQLDAVRNQYEDDAPAYVLHQPEIALYASALGKKLDAPPQDFVAYLWQNMRRPVLFHDCLHQALADGFNCFIEVGASSALLRYVHEAALDAGKEILAVSLCKKGEPEDLSFLTALAELYVGGLRFDPRSFPGLQRGRYGSLPRYAWHKTLYQPTVTTDVRTGQPCGSLLGKTLLLPLCAWENTVSSDASGLAGHLVLGRNLYPAAAYMQMLLEMAAYAKLPTSFYNLCIHAPVALDAADDTVFFTSSEDGYVNIRAADADRKNWIAAFAAECGTLPKQAPLKLSYAALPQQSNCALDSDAIYHALTLKGLAYDGAFRMLQSAEIGKQDARSIYLPHTQTAFSITETLLFDGMLQTAALAHRSVIGETFVPCRVEFLHVYAPLGSAVQAYAIIRSRQEDALVADAYLGDDSGNVVAAMTGICFHKLPNASQKNDLSHHCYQSVWEELRAGEEDAPLPAVTVWQPLTDDIEGECLRLNRVFLDLQGARGAVAVITHLAQAVIDGDTAENYRQALLWGFCRTARLEFSNLHIYLVDTDGPCFPADHLAELAKYSGRFEFARRDGRWYGLSVARRARAATPTPAPDGTCLITGGAGALAESLATDLAARGAKGIALIGRTRHRRVDTLLQVLRYFGVPAKFYAADVTDYKALAGVLARIDQTLPPLCGVFHFAGASRDALLTKLDENALRAAVAVKLGGAENLRRLTNAIRLKYFVLAGSLTGLTGNIGQGAYSAANAAYEALYHHISADQSACTLAAFGALDLGMSLRPKARENFRRHGIGLMRATDALESMWQNIQSAAYIAQLDWTMYLEVSGQSRDAKYRHMIHLENPMENLRERLKSMAPTDRDASVTSLLKTICADILKTDAEKIDTDRPLSTFGLDSLDTVMLAADVNKTFGTGYDYSKIAAASSIHKLAEEILSDLV